ncbi:MAG: TolC family outer membrane protein [Paracoccaceae bacterium]
MRRTHGLAAALLAAGLAGGLTSGHAARAESLADVLVEAYLNSPDLDAQRAQVKVQSEFAAQARSGNRPTVTGAIGLDVEISNTDFNDQTAVFPTTLSLTATQNLYTGGQVENSTAAAERRISVEETLLIATEQQVLLDAVTAFSDVRQNEFLVDVSENNVRVLTEQLRAARERFEVGEVTRTDVEQARARLAAARSNLAASRGQLAISRENFADVVGRPPEDLDTPPPLPDLPETVEDSVRIALESEPQLLAARIEREAAGLDVRAAIGALLPQIALVGQLDQFDTVPDDLGGSRAASIGLQVTLPFYSGGANYANVRQQQAEVEGAEASITTSIRDAVRNVGISWSQLEVARASIEAGRLEVRAAELAFEGVTEEAKVGARTTLDVLDAEEEVLDARASLITAQRDEYVAAYQLLFSMGMLTVDHLGLDVEQRDTPGSYYASVRDRNFGYDESDDTVWSLSYRP